MTKKYYKTWLSVILAVALIYTAMPFVFISCTQKYKQIIYIVFNNNITYWVFYLGLVVIPVITLFNDLHKEQSWSLLKKIFLGIFATIYLLFFTLAMYIFTSPYAGIGGGIDHAANNFNRGRQAMLENVSVALEKYYKQNKSYPQNLSELVPNFIKELPRDQVTNELNQYVVSSDKQDFVLKSDLTKFRQACFDQVEMATRAAKYFGYGYLPGKITGSKYGIDCGYGSYCVGPFHDYAQ